MTELFQNVLTASFHGSIVILAVLLLRFALKKTPKKFLCLLWLLAGIRLLMPFEIQSGLSLQPDVEPFREEAVIEAIPEPTMIAPVEILPEQPVQPVSQPEVLHGEVLETPVPDDVIGAYSGELPVAEPDPLMTMDAIIAHIWVAVAFCFVLYTFAS